MSVSLGYVIFYVPDVERAVAFYSKAFDMTPKFVTPENDYGELDTGATTLAFASEELAGTNLTAAGGFTPLSPDKTPPGAVITLTTDDVSGALEAAVAAGGRRYTEPATKPWGQTVAYLVDPFGALVELGTPVG